MTTGKCTAHYFPNEQLLTRNPTLSDSLDLLLLSKTWFDVEACCLEEKFESLMMERGSVVKEFLRAGDIGATWTVAAVEACHLNQKCESLMIWRAVM